MCLSVDKLKKISDRTLIIITLSMRMFQNVPECSRMFQNVSECSRLHADPRACLKVHELACRSMLHKLAWCYILNLRSGFKACWDRELRTWGLGLGLDLCNVWTCWKVYFISMELSNPSPNHKSEQSIKDAQILNYFWTAWYIFFFLWSTYLSSILRHTVGA